MLHPPSVWLRCASPFAARGEPGAPRTGDTRALAENRLVEEPLCTIRSRLTRQNRVFATPYPIAGIPILGGMHLRVLRSRVASPWSVHVRSGSFLLYTTLNPPIAIAHAVDGVLITSPRRFICEKRNNYKRIKHTTQSPSAEAGPRRGGRPALSTEYGRRSARRCQESET